MKKTHHIQCWRGRRDWNAHASPAGMRNSANTLEMIWRYLLKLDISMSSDPLDPIAGQSATEVFISTKKHVQECS